MQCVYVLANAATGLAPRLLQRTWAVSMLRTHALMYKALFAILVSNVLVAQSSRPATRNAAPSQFQLAAIVQGMQEAEASLARQAPYQVIREYRLFSGNNPVPTSRVLALLDFRPEDGKDYQIEEHSGSNRGEQIVRRILDREVAESTKPAEAQVGALTKDNYEFQFVSETTLDAHPCYLLRLAPKRKDKDLMVGQVWVDKGTLLIRHVEGHLVKSPSWWLKEVSVKISFNEVQGTWIQSDVEALADVRLVGPQTLRSHALGTQSLGLLAGNQTTGIFRKPRTQRKFNSIPAEAVFQLNHK